MRERFIKTYQNILSAVVVSASLLASVFMLGAYVERLAGQHDHIIKAQERLVKQQDELLQIYLKGYGR